MGKAEFIEQLAGEMDIKMINEQSDLRPSLLRIAISHGTKEHLPVIRKLLAMKASVNLPDSKGVTPLLAVPKQEKFDFNHPDILTTGVEEYSNNGVLSFKVSYTPNLTLPMRSETAILLLESKADITWSDKNHQTVVDIAIDHRQIYILAAISFYCLRFLSANRVESMLVPYLLKHLSSIVHDYLYSNVGMNSLVETYDKSCEFGRKKTTYFIIAIS